MPRLYIDIGKKSPSKETVKEMGKIKKKKKKKKQFKLKSLPKVKPKKGDEDIGGEVRLRRGSGDVKLAPIPKKKKRKPIGKWKIIPKSY